MPVERTTKTSLRQTALFGLAKPIALVKTKLSEEISASDAPCIPATPDASGASDVLEVSRIEFPPAGKPKRKGKSKAVDEDRLETDVILSIKPEFVKLISEQKKNHEYRKYKLKDSVVRLWLYETAPTSAIRYVIETGAPKVPGEVNDPSGIGNDDFDNGLKQSKYGYPVTGLKKLKKPVPTAELKERFDIAVPQGWRYATKSLSEGVLKDGMERLF